MAIMDRGGRGYARRKYSYSGCRVDGAMMPEAARESTKDSVPSAVIPGKLPVMPLRKQTPTILIMGAALCVFAFTLITQMANCTSAAKEVSRLTAEIKNTRIESEAIKQEIFQLENATRIMTEAQFTLGMVEPPDAQRYVSLPDIPRTDEPQTVAASGDSWLNTALRALGGY